jgi:micrococcal nuclease
MLILGVIRTKRPQGKKTLDPALRAMNLKSLPLALILLPLMLALATCGGDTASPLPTHTPYPTYTPYPVTTPEVVVKEVAVEKPVTVVVTATATAINGGSIQATVVKVVDGDTIEILMRDGTTDTVRLLGIDTPEINVPNKPMEYGNITDLECLSYWGQQASQYTKNTLHDNSVRIVLDETSPLRGYYGRLLAYVELNGNDFNKRLIELGYARAYTEAPGVRVSVYSYLEDEASTSRIGLWSCANEVHSHPPDASAICSDGTYSYSKNRGGTCSWHGGVREWLD